MFAPILFSIAISMLPAEVQGYIRNCGQLARVQLLDQKIIDLQNQISAAMRLPLEDQKSVIPPLAEQWREAVNQQRALGGTPPLPLPPVGPAPPVQRVPPRMR